jgi:microcystin-dependent protein
MADPYIGEIKIFCGNFAPVGWLMCDGSLLPISQYDVLFNLIGTTYGGDGQNTFAVPDLRGRFPAHRGSTMQMGQRAGEESVTITSASIAAHTHTFLGTTALATDPTPGLNTTAEGTTVQLFVEDVLDQKLSPNALAPYTQGGGQPHDNMHPYQVINYIIATEGIYPPPN